MIYDTVEVLKVDKFPTVKDIGTVTLTYLSTEWEGFKPGFYFFIDGEWKPFGGGAVGQAVKTATINTSDLTDIALAEHDPDGILLSVMVTKNVQGSRSVTLLVAETQEVLETVVLTNQYTAISIPQPHRLYALRAEANLKIEIKTI